MNGVDDIKAVDMGASKSVKTTEPAPPKPKPTPAPRKRRAPKRKAPESTVEKQPEKAPPKPVDETGMSMGAPPETPVAAEGSGFTDFQLGRLKDLMNQHGRQLEDRLVAKLKHPVADAAASVLSDNPFSALQMDKLKEMLGEHKVHIEKNLPGPQAEANLPAGEILKEFRKLTETLHQSIKQSTNALNPASNIVVKKPRKKQTLQLGTTTFDDFRRIHPSVSFSM